MGNSGAIDERASSLKGVTNLWWDHHIGFPGVANPDRHLIGHEFHVCTIIDEISRCGVARSRARSRLDAVHSSEESRAETEHGRRLITREMKTGYLLNRECSVRKMVGAWSPLVYSAKVMHNVVVLHSAKLR